jgi:M-phase inducer tyrosine phosphatase
MAMLSSPLAAMAPPPCKPNWMFGKEGDIPRSRASETGSFGRSTKLGFGDGSGSSQDYFTLKNAPIRGSSPTASLAADLSQNFFIEQRHVY